MASLDEIHDAANNLSTDDLQRLVNFLTRDLEERRKAPRTRSAEIAAATIPSNKKKNSKSIEVDDILDTLSDD